MAENTSRYRMEEFQDHEGNVVYHHTSASVTWLKDGTSAQAYLDEYALTESDLNEIFAS